MEMIALMPDTMTEPMHCMMIAGKPTAYIFFSVSLFILKPLSRILTSCFLTKSMISTNAMEQNCPNTVAIAAPKTPSLGKKPMPNISRGSKMMLTTAPSIWVSIGKIMLPVDCRIFSPITDNCIPSEKHSTTVRY